MGLALKMIITSVTSKHLTNLILEMYKQRCLLSWELASEMCPTFPWLCLLPRPFHQSQRHYLALWCCLLTWTFRYQTRPVNTKNYKLLD